MSLFLIIIAGTLLGLSYLSSKRLAEEPVSSSTLVLSYAVIGAIAGTPFALHEFGIPSSVYHWSLSVISPLLFGLSAFFSYKAYKLTDASIVGLVSRVNIVVSAVLGVLLFHEAIQGLSVLGLILVLLGSLLIIYDGTRIKIHKGIVYALGMGVIYGLLVVIDKVVIQQFSPYTYVSFNNVVVAFCFFVFTNARKELVKLWRTNPLWSLFTSVSGLGSWILFLVALENGSVSFLYPVWESIGLIVTVLLGIVCFKETGKVWQKVLGMVITIVGIVLIH